MITANIEINIIQPNHINHNVSIGKGSCVGPFCVLGQEPTTTIENKIHQTNHFLKIGDYATIRSGTVIYTRCTIGSHFDCSHNVYIREDTCIGHHVYVMASSCIGRNVIIGNNVRVMGRITDGALIEDEVISLGFLVDDKYAGRGGGDVKTPPILRKGCTVGAGSIINENIEIGEGAFVGAGAVVTKNVEPFALVVGNPARKIKDIREIPNFNRTTHRKLYLHQK